MIRSLTAAIVLGCAALVPATGTAAAACRRRRTPARPRACLAAR